MADENTKILNPRERFKQDDNVIKKNTAEFVTVGNTTVVGEEHIRSSVNSENEKEFESRLKSSEVVVLEHDPSLPTNYYTKNSPQKRFMESALEHAKDTKKPLYILDSKIDDSLEHRYSLLKKGGYDISKSQYAYATSINTVLSSFGATQEDIKQHIHKRLQGFLSESEIGKVIDKVIADYDLSMTDPNFLKKTQTVQKSFALIDRQTHEQEYQRQILEIANNNPGKKIAFVVGKSHTDAIRKSLEDSRYLTPRDEVLYESFVEVIPSFEEDLSSSDFGEDQLQEEPQGPAPRIQTPRSYSQPEPTPGVGGKVDFSRAFEPVKNLASKTANNAKTAAKTGIKKGLGKLAAAAAPFLAKAGLAIAGGIAIILALLALLARIFITVLIWTVGFTLFVVFVLFIINSGAYMVPPGENLSENPVVGDSQCINTEHPECPCGWPVLPLEGEGVLDVYQGSHTLLGVGTHRVIEAIDIIHLPEGYLSPGHPVTSRVTGTVRTVWSDPAVYGNAVEIESTCNGNTVILRYGHNTAVIVAQGENVTQNQVIAYSGDSGMGGPHVHYEFANPTSFAMQPVNIPKSIPEGCNSWANNPYPCNVQIP